MLDRLRIARICTKVDLLNPTHFIRIVEGDKYKTAFRTWYGQFEYHVMLFGLTNTTATFQAYFDDGLRPFIDDFAGCYLENILIYSTEEPEHEEQVRSVLERL
jgi:hypothetical protein